MKLLTILIFVLIISFVIGAFYYLKEVIGKLSFKFDLAGINLNDLLAGTLIPTINVSIKNESNLDIRFSHVEAKLFYNGKLIAQNRNINTQTLIVPKFSTTQFPVDMNFYLNNDVIDGITKIISNQPITIYYHVDLRTFGVPIPTIKGSFDVP